MEYLVKDEKLELKYVPGKGAWTYHIQLPNTKHIVGKWGSLKASGTVNDFKIENKNLFTIKGQDKLLSINDAIRKAINKGGGDMVTVTLYLSAPKKEELTENEILETFNDSGVLQAFEDLSEKERAEIVTEILHSKSEDKQVKTILKFIDQLSKTPPSLDGVE